MDELHALAMAAFAALVAFCFGVVVGAQANAKVWAKDCKLTGIHRDDDVVYECRVKGGAQ
jgi:hypothetical protein